MRSLSPVEAALCVAIGGSVLAVGGPAFVRNLHASRLVEPIDGLGEIAARAASVAMAREASRGLAYPASAPQTPREVPAGEAVEDPPGSWSHPTWQELRFGFTEPHSFAFEFQSELRGRRSRYRAVARGDLDGDRELSEFSIEGEVGPGEDPVTMPLEMRREIE